jgi:hypothetical protein
MPQSYVNVPAPGELDGTQFFDDRLLACPPEVLILPITSADG